jgi:glycosyltransferase involved in cell wall biosynthesis
VWQNAVLDPAMLAANGMTESGFRRLVEIKRAGFEQATVIQVSTEAERVRHVRAFPDLADRFQAVPFFVPGAAAIPMDVLARKLDRSGSLKCLFVGHEARRKGLDRVFQAFARLSPNAARQVHLTVVSKQTDGRVSVIPPASCRVEAVLPHDQVMRLMQESDVLIMPSRFESYGLVYLEAMSQGTIPVVPDWEVQRELVGEGAAGITTPGTPEHLATLLTELIEDQELRYRLSLAARQRFELMFAPRVVAAEFAALFLRAAFRN